MYVVENGARSGGFLSSLVYLLTSRQRCLLAGRSLSELTS